MQQGGDLGRRILSEHAAVRRAIRDIRAELERLEQETGHAHEAGELARMLRELGTHLERHFELEEQGGLFGEVRVDTGTRRGATVLLDQHGALGRELAALRDAAERAQTERARLSDGFVQGLRAFLGHLGEHERAENELVQKVVVEDLGAGD